MRASITLHTTHRLGCRGIAAASIYIALLSFRHTRRRESGQSLAPGQSLHVANSSLGNDPTKNTRLGTPKTVNGQGRRGFSIQRHITPLTATTNFEMDEQVLKGVGSRVLESLLLVRIANPDLPPCPSPQLVL